MVASPQARSLVSIERVPKSLQLATVAIEDQRFYEHAGLDYEGILRAALKDLEAGEAVEGGSTITQQLVRNLCIRSPKRTLEAQDRRGEAGDRVRRTPQPQGNPRLLPQRRLLRDGRRELPRSASAPPRRIFFSKPVWKLKPAGSGAAGRAAAGALRIQPAAQPRRRRKRAATQVLRQMAKLGYISEARARAAMASGLRVNLDEGYFEHREPYFFDYVENELIEQLRGEHGAARRPRGADDDRPGAAGGRAGSDALGASLLDRPLLGTGLDRPPQRRDPGDGLQLRLRTEQVQPRRPGAPPAGLDLQDLRPDDGDPAGHRPLHHLLHLETAGPLPAAVGTLDRPHRRRRLFGDGQPAAGDGRLRQHRLRPARPRRRAEGGGGDGALDGDRLAARRDPGRGDRRPAGRRLAAGDVERLRDPRRRRRAPQADRRHQGRLPQRPRRPPGPGEAASGRSRRRWPGR